MTSRDIKNLSIIAEIKDGQYLVTVTENKELIDMVVRFCQFAIVKPKLIEQMSLKELAINEPKED